MVIGRHQDGRIFLMAHEHGLGSMIRSKVGVWTDETLSAEEMNDFIPIRDESTKTVLLNEAKQSKIVNQDVCICPKDCDCANPDGKGVASVSEACPEHNSYPRPVLNCTAKGHNGGQEWSIW